MRADPAPSPLGVGASHRRDPLLRPGPPGARGRPAGRRGRRGPLLHLKGPALLPGLRAPGSRARDADVLVRPDQFDRARGALRGRGWEPYSHLQSGSAFEHAANWWHPTGGTPTCTPAGRAPTVEPRGDVRRPRRGGFDQLIAHVPARSRAAPRRSWSCCCTPPGRPATATSSWPGTSRAREQRARRGRRSPTGSAREVALAAALGDLESYRGGPAATTCGSSTARAAAGSTSGGRATGRPPLPGGAAAGRPGPPPGSTATTWGSQLGRPPTRAEVRRAQLGRIGTLVRESGRIARASGSARRRDGLIVRRGPRRRLGGRRGTSGRIVPRCTSARLPDGRRWCSRAGRGRSGTASPRAAPSPTSSTRPRP